MANFHITGMPFNMLFAGLGLPLLPENDTYKAIITPEQQRTVVGSIITLDGRRSTSPNGDPLNYFWSFKEYPIGSQVDKYLFTSNEVDDSIVSFSPDVPGFYTIALVVGDNNFLSQPGFSEAYITILIVPQNQGLVPDAEFIWNYLGDFWSIYSDKNKWSTIWSSMVQITANELLTSYQVDYNKSIRDIQDLFQKKWINYNPRLDLVSSDCTFILADDYAGTQAATSLLGMVSQPDYSNIITIPIIEGSFTKTPYGKAISKGKVLSLKNSSYITTRATDIGNRSAAFTSLNNIHTGFSNLPWRLSSTLIHKSMNFEKQGVSRGDVLAVEIAKEGSNKKALLHLQICSVSNDRIGVVFNTDSLQEGIPALGLSDADQLYLSKSLTIAGLNKALDGSLVYADDALTIKNTLNSFMFKRAYYETELDFTTIVKIGPISIKARPLFIIRNSKIAIDSRISSIPGLQENIKQPEIVKINGTISKNVNNKFYPLLREPYLLFENLDYIVDDESALEANCIITANSSLIQIPWGDLIDKNIQENDTLYIAKGLNAGTYTIRQIINPEVIMVTPIPQATEINIKGIIKRQVAGKFIRFVNKIFTPKNIAPDRLWAEVSYIDNSKAIEDNFGVLVELSKERKEKQGISAPYKSAVAGLMYAYSRGPTIYNLKLGAQVLLGLPFAYHRGVIISINPEYRLGDQLEPLFGRILIQERDSRNRPTGLVDVYLYPRGKQTKVQGKWVDQDPDFSGLGINPKTGRIFREGDEVDAFTILSKGIEVVDYLSNPSWYEGISGDPITAIQKYHKAYLRANIDLYNTADFDFVADFLRKTKPHYISLVAIALKSLVDDIIVEDNIYFKVIYTFFEAMGLSLPTAAKYDGYYVTPEFMVYDGVMYTRYIYGSDLVTSQTNNIVTSSAGGFINARSNELHDTPYIRPKDLLFITNGFNKGRYIVNSVNSDTSITIFNTGVFQTLNNQDFSIYRPIQNPIFKGQITVAIGQTSCLLANGNGGPLSSGIAVNDIVVFSLGSTTSRQYRIASISSGVASLDKSVVEASGTYSVAIYREGLLVKSLLTDETTTPFIATTTNGNPWVSIAGGDLTLLAPTIIKDTLYINGYPPYTILDYDETLPGVYVTPTPTITEDKPAKIWRTYLPSKSISVDIVDHFIDDPLTLTMTDNTNTCSIAGPGNLVSISAGDTPQDLGIVPGDLFKLIAGNADSSRDLGYGPGVVPIASLQGLDITVTRSFTAATANAQYAYIKKTK